MAFNTGNPLGSTDPRDFSDNSENLDRAVNNTASATWTDRFGNARTSLAGQIGYIGTGVDGAIEDYAAGQELTTFSTIIRYSGEFYRPAAGATLPYTTTATTPDVDANLVSVGDATLRQDLAGDASAGNGAALVNGATIYVGSVADSLADYAANVTDGQEFIAAGYLPGVFAYADPATRGGGRLIYAAGVAKSSHNGVTIFSATVPKVSSQTGANQRERRDAYIAGTGETDPSGNGCFIRPDADTVYSSWAGTFADETNDDYAAIQAAIDAAPSTFFLDKGSHLTSATLTVDSPINIHGTGSERTADLGSHIRHTGASGDGLIYSDTVAIYDRTVKDISITSVNGHALHPRYGVTRCEFLNLRLDSRTADKSAIYADYTAYGVGIFTCRFIGGEYFGPSGITRTRSLVDLTTDRTLINENVFRDMWVSYGLTLPAISVVCTDSGTKITNNKFESITFEICSGGLINLQQAAHSKIDGVSAWDNPTYTSDLITLNACSSTTIINYGRIGGSLSVGVVDVRNTGAGGGLVFINFSDVGAAGESIDWGGQTGAYISGLSATLDHQNADRVVRLEGDKVTSKSFESPDGLDVALSATGDSRSQMTSEHSGTTQGVSMDANPFFGGNGAFRPNANGVLDLGASGNRWKRVHAADYAAGGSAGVSGTFTTADGKTVTVTGGIITNIV